MRAVGIRWLGHKGRREFKDRAGLPVRKGRRVKQVLRAHLGQPGRVAHRELLAQQVLPGLKGQQVRRGLRARLAHKARKEFRA